MQNRKGILALQVGGDLMRSAYLKFWKMMGSCSCMFTSTSKVTLTVVACSPDWDTGFESSLGFAVNIRSAWDAFGEQVYF